MIRKSPKKPDGRSTRAVWQQAEKSIRNIESWPPGAFIVYDSRKTTLVNKGIVPAFVGLGVVVANDGIDRIRVIWGANCRDAFLEYTVSTLNPEVIRFLE